MSILFVLSLFLLLDAPLSCIAENNSTFDYFIFVVQWPKGFCEYERITGKRYCRIIPNKFTIHGLWPEKTSGGFLQNCSTNALNPEDVKDLRKQLMSDWPNLIGSDDQFWMAEWLKHGTCSEKMYSKHDYFKLALSSLARNNLKDVLGKAKIVPNKKQLYNATAVADAIRAHTGHHPELDCYTDPKLNASALYSVRLCLSASGTSYVDCQRLQGTCREELLFPK